MSRLRRHHRRLRRRRGMLLAATSPRPAADPASRAGQPAAREPQNWPAHDVFVDNRYIFGGTSTTREDKACSRRSTTSSAATSSYGAALSAAPGGLRRLATTTASRPVADRLRGSSSRTHAADSATRCTAPVARTRPSRPRSAPFPFPAVRHQPRIQQLSDDLAAAGAPVPRPVWCAVVETDRPDSDCVRCGSATASPTSFTPKFPTRRSTAFTPHWSTRTSRCLTDEDPWYGWAPIHSARTVTEVVIDHHGAHGFAREDLVVVSCGAAETRPSCSSRQPTDKERPNGLADRTDQVGRNYVFHDSPASGPPLSHEPNPTVFQKTLGMNDFYFGPPTSSITRSATSRWSASPRRRCTAARSRSRPGSRRSARSSEVARHAVDFWLSTEDLPRAENRVTLRDGRRRSGSATRRPTTSPKQRLLHELKSLLGRPRHAPRPPDAAARVPQERHPGRRLRAPGRARAASAPTRRRRCSNTDCRAHEVDNLYVVDTSFFPSIGAVNPALTAMANALRVGDHLLERMGARRRPDGGRACRLTTATAAARRRRRRRLRRRRLRQAARARGRRPRHADRPPQLPPVPAALERLRRGAAFRSTMRRGCARASSRCSRRRKVRDRR